MPHIVVEYSDTLSDRLDIRAMLSEMHAALGAEDSVDPKRLKSRAIPLADFIVGEDTRNGAMIHITLKLMPRPPGTFKHMAQILHAIARRHARASDETCAVTAEVVELNPETYCP